jgi:DNA (cytosine-5)-methyltransferase 1
MIYQAQLDFNIREKALGQALKHTSKKFLFVDLFAGIGGIRMAFEKAGGQCVYSSEIDTECIKTYEANFGEFPDGDITKTNPSYLPDHDVLCAGFPCQPFSISGKMRGFEDTRGTLFFNILEIIKEKGPRVVFLENVKHLIHHNNGRTIKVILKSLENEGYKVAWKVLNALDFGLPQNRERIIIVASKKDFFDFDYVETTKNKLIEDIIEKEGNFEVLPENDYTILPRSLWRRQKSGLIFCGYRNRSIRKSGVRPNTKHLSRVHKQPNRIYYIKGTHPTLPSQETAGRFWIYDGNKVRKLTINECYRLMGFPDCFKKVSKNGELYKQIGNSVAVPMMESLATSIKKQLL